LTTPLSEQGYVSEIIKFQPGKCVTQDQNRWVADFSLAGRF
jgi:hypothetical protein